MLARIGNKVHIDSELGQDGLCGVGVSPLSDINSSPGPLEVLFRLGYCGGTDLAMEDFLCLTNPDNVSVCTAGVTYCVGVSAAVRCAPFILWMSYRESIFVPYTLAHLVLPCC